MSRSEQNLSKCTSRYRCACTVRSATSSAFCEGTVLSLDPVRWVRDRLVPLSFSRRHERRCARTTHRISRQRGDSPLVSPVQIEKGGLGYQPVGIDRATRGFRRLPSQSARESTGTPGGRRVRSRRQPWAARPFRGRCCRFHGVQTPLGPGGSGDHYGGNVRRLPRIGL